jgi:hypothetical protein
MALTPEGTPYVESTDLVANYPAASLSLANRVDLVGVLPFADAAARTAAIPSPTDGQFTYLQDTNTAEFYDGSAFVSIGGGKVLQVVRATDATSRSTTNTAAFVDASISVTITPQKSNSNVILLWAFLASSSTARTVAFQITDSANVAISGAEAVDHTYAANYFSYKTLVAYIAPGVTTAVTYKGRFKSGATNTLTLNNNLTTGQIYAIEVAV